MIRVSLLLKKEMRREVIDQSPSRVSAIYQAPAHRAVAMDAARSNFELPYNTQADAPTQADGDQHLDGHAVANIGNAPEEAESAHLDAVRADDDLSPEHDLPAEEEPEDAREEDVPAERILQFEDLEPHSDFWAKGLGPNGTQILKGSEQRQELIEDRWLMQKLFKQGKSSFIAKDVAALWHVRFDGQGARKRVALPFVIKLFTEFSKQFPRLAVYDAGELKLRDCPDEESDQDKMHNDCMRAFRLTLNSVSEARVKWMARAAMKREIESEVPVAGAAAADIPPRPPRRRLEVAAVPPMPPAVAKAPGVQRRRARAPGLDVGGGA